MLFFTNQEAIPLESRKSSCDYDNVEEDVTPNDGNHHEERHEAQLLKE